MASSFAPRPVLVALVGLAALVGAGLAAATDPLGRILFGVVAAGLAGEALRSALLRPVVAVTAEGLLVVEGLRRVLLPWPEIRAVRAVRLGHLMPGRVLEVETGARSFVWGSYRLGVRAEDAASAIGATVSAQQR
jgi:hypothetical protein